MSKKWALLFFLVVVAAQLYVPAKMILDKEDVLITGTEYKFKTAPIDPADPFRGKYIVLDFADNTVAIPKGQEWSVGEEIYVLLTTDDDGFARIQTASRERPAGIENYLKAKVSYSMSYASANAADTLIVGYPFDRYYMEESKAQEAEVAYRQAQLDTNQVAYALVRIKDGNAALKDVMIDGISIREWVKLNRENRNDE